MGLLYKKSNGIEDRTPSEGCNFFLKYQRSSLAFYVLKMIKTIYLKSVTWYDWHNTL